MKKSSEILAYDVVIIGGGTSGALAAIEALNNNLSVVIIEKTISLGGTMTNALVNPMMPSFARNTELVTQMQHKLETFEQTQLRVEGNSFWFNPETVKYVFEDEIRSKGGVILYDSIVIAAQLKADKITGVTIYSRGSQREIQGKCFIDCSGDAILARLVQIPTVAGDEITGINQATSFRFEIGGIDITMLRMWCKSIGYTFNPCISDAFFEFVHVPQNQACGQLLAIFAAAVENKQLHQADARYIQGFSVPTKPGVLSFNGPQLKNEYKTTDIVGMSHYVSEGRKMQRRLFLFLKENIPGFLGAYIAQEAKELGVRESVRIVGKYVLNEQDYLQRQKFADGIVAADWYIDVHADELAVENNAFKAKYEPGEYYEIPYRSMVCSTISNYIAAGRHISTTFKVQSSVRIQYTCQNMGVMAARACAYSLAQTIELNQIDGSIFKK
ncbi:MAG: FAD-dependent oxidoreductase [Culicoidibacterales bacterium]